MKYILCFLAIIFLYTPCQAVVELDTDDNGAVDIARGGTNSTTGDPVFTSVTSGSFLSSAANGYRVSLLPANTVPYTVVSGETGLVNESNVIYQFLNGGTKYALLDTSSVEYGYDFIPVAWMKDGSAAPAALDTTTRVPYAYRDFSGSATKDLNFIWIVPFDYKSGTAIQFATKSIVTAATGPSSEGIAWTLSGASMGAGDASNATKGTGVAVTQTALTQAQWTLLMSAWSGDVTITNIAAGETVELNISRHYDNASDTYVQNVGLTWVLIRYQRLPVRP
jgi:hypothetical protein